MAIFVFSQKIRHIAASEVSCRVKAGNDIWRRFSELVNSSSFYEELDTAIQHPDSSEAKKILGLVLPMIQISGGKIPYGPIERKCTITSLYNELRWFGLPIVFATLSPYDMDNLLIMRIIKEGNSNDPYNYNFQIPSNDERAMIIAQNPVLAADMYMRQSIAYDELLFGLSPASLIKTTKSFSDRESGIFGKPVADRKCNEGQGKGTLHRHGIHISHITCDILARISAYPPLVKKMASAIDSMIKGEIDAKAHVAGLFRRHVNKTYDRHGLKVISPDMYPSHSNSIFHDICNMNIDSTNWHRHQETCRKGKAGRYGCRLCRPYACRSDTGVDLVMYPEEIEYRHILMKEESTITPEEKDFIDFFQHCNFLDPADSTTVPSAWDGPIPEMRQRDSNTSSRDAPFKPTDDRNLVWEIRRPNIALSDMEIQQFKEEYENIAREFNIDHDQFWTKLGENIKERNGRIIEFNDVVAVCIGCNQSMSLLGTLEQAKVACFYMVKYMVKDATALSNTLSLIYEARKIISANPSIASNSGKTALHLSYKSI